MWGKVISRLNLCCCRGITPTHVGKSIDLFPIFAADKDHPHPCGEKDFLIDTTGNRRGSPPPMWGKDNLDHVEVFRLRITPTHVGKRKHRTRQAVYKEDHPHPCGEKAPMVDERSG